MAYIVVGSDIVTAITLAFSDLTQKKFLNNFVSAKEEIEELQSAVLELQQTLATLQGTVNGLVSSVNSLLSM